MLLLSFYFFLVNQRCDVEQKVVHEIHALRVDGSNPSIALFLSFFYFQLIKMA